MVDALLRAGANPNRTNENGDSAIDIALRYNHTDIAGALRKAGGRSGKSVTLEVK